MLEENRDKSLEKYRLDDGLRALAYEEADICHKACIKSAIALHFSLLEKFVPIKKKEERSAFFIESEKKSARTSIYIIDEDYTSPALFIAALMPALMAQSSPYIVFLSIPSKELLLCLELLGLEEVFYMPNIDQVLENFDLLGNDSLSMLCIYLGNKYKAEIEAYSKKQDIHFYSSFEEPRVFADRNKEIFTFAYPNSQILDINDEINEKNRIDIVFNNLSEKIKLKYEKNFYASLFVNSGLEFYYPALFDEKIFIQEQKSIAFAE